MLSAVVMEHSRRKHVRYDPVEEADRTRRRHICSITVVAVLLVLSVMGSVLVWTLDPVDSYVMKSLILTNTSSTFKWWVDAPLQPLLKIRAFNYTNVKEYEAGIDKKLRVEEVGPYTFRQYMSKIDIEFTDEATVKFRNNFKFEYVPELSPISIEANFTQLNSPLLGMVALLRNYNSISQIGAGASLKMLGMEPFLNIPMKEFLYGYKSIFAKLASIAVDLGLSKKEVRLGFIEERSGEGEALYEAFTGASDLKKLGQILRYDDMDHIEAFGDTNCSRIDGTDGSFFPPHLVQQKMPLHIYNKDFCRKFPFEFKEDLQVDGLPVRRYQPPRNIFSSPDINPDNACFCSENKCAPSGSFNASVCYMDAPIFISFPHFYLAGKELQESIDGLKPDPEKHDMYLDVHPTLGSAMGGKTSIQFNCMVKKAPHIRILDSLSEGDVLPIMWFEVVAEKLPPEMHELFYHGTYTVKTIKHLVNYGIILLSMALIFLLIFMIYKFHLCVRK